MKHIKHCSVIAALAAAALTFAGVAPAALAANDGATQDAVVATRSFPKTNAVKKNIPRRHRPPRSNPIPTGAVWKA